MTLADRRLTSRFDVVGTPWGVLDALEPLHLRNLSSDGMLIESPAPLAVGSVHEFQLIDGPHAVRVRAAVRHLSPARRSSVDRYFVIGLEFLHLEPRSSLGIGRLVREQLARPASEEA
jgi:hypothetical protein